MSRHNLSHSGKLSVFASAVNSYMATIERSPTPKAKSKQKQRLNTSAAAGGAGKNTCRNPFCGAALNSVGAKYCVQKLYCQLYRGVVLHCGTFASVAEAAVDVELDALREAKRRKKSKVKQQVEKDTVSTEKDGTAEATTESATAFSIPKRKVPLTPTKAAEKQHSSATTAADESDDQLLGKAERKAQRTLKRQLEEQQQSAATGEWSSGPGSVDASDAEKHTNGKKRRIDADESGSSSGPFKPSSAPSQPPPASKVQGIEVIPLGAGRHHSSFGGSRYVQSGNRPMVDTLRSMNPLARPPSVPRMPVSAAPATDNTNSASTAAQRGDLRLQQTAPTNPRRSEPSSNAPDALTAVTPSSSPVGAQEPHIPAAAAATTQNGRPRIISASEYLSSRKLQDPRVRANPPPSNTTDPAPMQLRRTGSDLSAAYQQQQQHSGSPSMGSVRERTFARSTSDPIDLTGYRGSGSRSEDYDFRYSESNRRNPPSHDPYTGTSSSNGVARGSPRKHHDSGYHGRPPSSYDDRRESDVRYDPYRSGDCLPPRPPSPNRYNDHSYEPSEYHHRHPSSSSSSSSHYPHDPPPSHWQQRQSDDMPPSSSYRSSSRESSGATTTPRVKTEQQVASRREPAHPEIEQPTFSKHDRFMKNVLSRFASFFPQALSPVLNKTTKPRKMRFYLDYVQRVERLSGSNLEVQIGDGKGIVKLGGRVWLLLQNSSTVELYKLVLEKLLQQGIAWRKLIDDSNRVYANAVQKLGSRAERSESFMRMWQGMKHTNANELPTERQVIYFRGAKRHHWSFSIGNVEIGSGSHEEKKEAIRLAADDAMRFLLSLDILNDSQKYSDRRHEQSTRHELPPRREERGHSSSASTTSNNASATPRSSTVAVPAAIEVVDAPDVPVSRPREDSFSSSNNDATFSPVLQSDHSVTEEDMDISDDGAFAFLI
ncbi:hypothetical protein FI667_g16340, partial [Globisporangium splendens]